MKKKSLAAEQQRDTAARAAARQNPQYRAAEQQRDTAARAAARQDPAYRAAEQLRRRNPERRAAEQQRNTAAHAQARDQVHAIQLPQASLLERLRDLMRFPCLHEGHRPALPDFLEAIPEGVRKTSQHFVPGWTFPTWTFYVPTSCALLPCRVMHVPWLGGACPALPKSHGIAVVNPDPNMLRGQLPARVADLAGAFTVVCVDQVRDRQDLLDRVRRAPGLKVRGNVIVAWVRFLQHNDEDEGAVDEEALQEYERMGCVARVPEALLHSAIGPTDPEVAGVLRSTFLHDRTGAAGVRQLQETLQGNVAGEIIQGGGAYGSPLDTGPDGPTAGTTASDTRMAALALAYALCEMWYPSPYYAPTPDSGTQPLVMGMSDAEAQQHGLPVPAVQADCPPAAYNFERLAGCANGGLPPPSRHTACRAHHAAVIRSTLTHSHSSTCKRHGCRGTDDSCGMAFPRLIRTAFQWIGTTGLFLLPCLAPNLVPHMPAIALAFGCNHLMSLACEVDREYTADIAAQLARPPNEHGDCSLLQPAIDRARDAAYYSSKYTAKTIERSQAHLTCAAVGRVQDFMMAGHRPSATGDGPSTFGNLCTVVHRMTATITAGMALVAFKLSGHDTFQATYKRNYLPIGAFTALASESAVEPEDAETGVELVEADEHGDYTLTSVVQNYTQRGVELSGLDCSAYSIASNFEVKRITPAQHPHAAILSAQVLPVPGRRKRKAPGAAMTPTTDAPPTPSGTQPTAAMASPAPAGPSAEQLPTSPMSTIPPKNVAFQPMHPLYLTHVLHRLAQPRYVLLGGALPRRPQEGSITAVAVAYYAFVLGIFKAHRGQPVAADQTVKEAYDAWWMDLGSTEAGRLYRACVSVLLDNIEAEHLASARRQADYNLRRRQRRATAATAGLAPDNSSSDPDDDDPEAARGRLEPDPATQPPQDDQVERYDFVPGQGDPTLGINLSDVALTDLYDRTTVEGLYAYGAARRCRVLPLPNALGANTNPFIRRVRTTDIPLLSEASKRLKRYLVISEGTATMPTMTDHTPHLRLDRHPGYPLVAVIVTDTQQTNHITAGMPTYLRLPQPPSIDDTIELFTLAPDQAVPFMLMARYFDHRNEPDPGVPPQMLIMGPPGTGKTQFVHTLLWYTYQHDSPDWAATCAYSWAAAIAFNTPVHRSLSTHSMFGISASQSGSRGANLPKRGAHAGLQVKRNVGDGAVLIDEIGMQSHEHLGAISHSCTANVPPPPHLGPAHPSSRVLSGRVAGGIGDLLQHPQPGGSPPYRYAANGILR
ncbi:hypothetical protein VOLCADRAFT_100891, partial [Volvox carteri f. nagariensis]